VLQGLQGEREGTKKDDNKSSVFIKLLEYWFEGVPLCVDNLLRGEGPSARRRRLFLSTGVMAAVAKKPARANPLGAGMPLGTYSMLGCDAAHNYMQQFTKYWQIMLNIIRCSGETPA